jgi:large subunit ribosomal protein L32
MPVPKRKTSRTVRDQRRAGNNNVTAMNVSACPQCHQPKAPHHVCPSCGYYKGREVVQTD